jgi:hypothetical protein
MTLTPQMNRYETCLMCGGPVPMGMPCPACVAGKPVLPATVLAPPSSMTPDMKPLVAPLVWEQKEGGFSAFCDVSDLTYFCLTDEGRNECDTVRAARIIAALDPAALAAMIAEARDNALREVLEIAGRAVKAAHTDEMQEMANKTYDAIEALNAKEPQT